MLKKDLAKTYTKKVGVKQLLEDLHRGPPEEIPRPVAAGGRSVAGIPTSMSEEYLRFVDGIDEVPPWLRSIGWAIISRMNALTYIDGDFDFERIMHGVRAMLRALQWDRKLTMNEAMQIENYVGIQLRKSKLGKERRLIAPGYQDITHTEANNAGSVIDERAQGNAAMGLLHKGKRGGYP